MYRARNSSNEAGLNSDRHAASDDRLNATSDPRPANQILEYGGLHWRRARVRLQSLSASQFRPLFFARLLHETMPPQDSVSFSLSRSAAGASAGANGGADVSTPTEEQAFDAKAAAVAESSGGAMSPGRVSSVGTPDPADLERIISLAESLKPKRLEVGAPRPGDEDDRHEMSDEEQFELARRIRRVDIAGQPVAVDMEIIRPYKNLLYHGGFAQSIHQ